MADQVTNYQCPSCGGPLHWDATLQKLKCDFCGSTFSNAEIEELYGEETITVDEDEVGLDIEDNSAEQNPTEPI